MNKEEAYDAQIAPLMTEIIKICKEYKIAMLAQFSTPNDDDPDLVCTTGLLMDEHEPNEAQIEAFKILRRGKSKPLFLTVRDQESNIQSITAILD
jgi:hypothetical protein